MLIISVCSCFELAKQQRDMLSTLYPGIGAILIQESSTGYGFVIKTPRPKDEFESITGLTIRYDLTHMG